MKIVCALLLLAGFLLTPVFSSDEDTDSVKPEKIRLGKPSTSENKAREDSEATEPDASPLPQSKIGLRIEIPKPKGDAEVIASAPLALKPARSQWSLSLRAMFSGGQAFQSDLSEYSVGLANYLATVASTQSSQSLSVSQTQNLATHVSFGLEAAVDIDRWRVLASARYFDFRNAEFELKNSMRPDKLTIAPSAFAFQAMALYRVTTFLDMPLHAGAGFGVFPAGVSIVYESSGQTQTGQFWGWNFGVSGRVELVKRFDFLEAFAGIQGDYAPVQKFENSGIAIINGNTGKVVGGGVVGFSLVCGVGYTF